MRRTILAVWVGGLMATVFVPLTYAQTTAPTAPTVAPPVVGPPQPPQITTSAKSPSTTADPNHVLRLYTDGFAASYLAVPGFAQVDMPVRDATDGEAGCYIACSSHQRHGSFYAPDPNTFVVGAVRIIGNYRSGVCRPGGQEHIDLAADTRLTELCGLAMPKVCDRQRCFASGDTGTWVPPSQMAPPPSGSHEPPSSKESCVLACYSHNGEGALYQVASDIFAVGGFQTGGKYVESVCKPEHFDGDLGADLGFKHRCAELFPKQCANDACWANGDTRGRLGGT